MRDLFWNVQNAGCLKITPVQVFSCEFWKLFKNTFFTEHRATASEFVVVVCFTRLNVSYCYLMQKR